jgi:hypothetical protein
MRLATTSFVLFVATCMCSCSTVLPETNPDHQTISALIRTQVQNSETTVKDPIRIEICGNKATAYYTVGYRTAQQPWNPMKSKLVRQDGVWVVKESKSTKPWYYRYK